jgi:Peptidase family M50
VSSGTTGPASLSPQVARSRDVPGDALPRLAAALPVTEPVPDRAGQLRPRSRSGDRKSTLIAFVLLAISLVTTTGIGARFMRNFLDGTPPVVRDSDLWPWPWLFEHPEFFVTGLAFSGALLTILLTHEFGHYFACRWHRIRTTLPWVLPAPTLSGTAGAIIQLRSKIKTRDALMDVGIYGPLAGYLVSVAAIAVGFTLSFTAPADAPVAIVRFGAEPLTIRFIHDLLQYWDPSIPAFENIVPHPILIAGWIGLFITSLNLIPGGQLDGGHILYAVSPRLHRWVTKILPFVLFLAGARFWVGWLLWGGFLLIPAMRHPKVPTEPQLKQGRLFLAIIALLIFLLTVTPTPFFNNSLMHFLPMDPWRTAQ